MPVSARTPKNEFHRLRPYEFHGVHLEPGSTHAVGDCPFCGREGKFSVEIGTGLWRCFVCGTGTDAGGGNGLVFTRLIYEHSTRQASPTSAGNGHSRGVGRLAARRGDRPPGANVAAFLASVAEDRRLLSPEAVAAWGIGRAADGTWLVPGYGTDGKLDQVYRRVRVQERGEWVWRLLPTPGIWAEGKAHALHIPVGDFDPARPNLAVFEGPWDGMAAWEVWHRHLGDTNLVAVPGCGTWRDEWTQMARGKHVVLFYDSDHPRETVPGKVSRAGYDGMVRVAKRLSGVAASVRYIRWGPDGYNPARPSGWDVRDHLAEGGDLQGRQLALLNLLSRVEDTPREWFNPVSPMVNGTPWHSGSAEAAPCSTWEECEAAWREAARWRRDIGDALAVLLAVCASTQQAGNQLFMDLIGSPGSLKTTLCRGLLVSGHCIHLENVTKLISGFKKPGDDEKDCSFLARANGKTWITCEFDVLGSSHQYHELMGKVRRIFDGETSATYGNNDEDRIYRALRTPWIRAGTPKMMDHDQSQLGDRFMRYILEDPDDRERREIARSALRSERLAMIETASATSGSILDPKMRMAHSLTGGYVDWLRANVEERLSTVGISEAVEDRCIDLAELSADLRARPQQHRGKPSDTVESHDYKELPTRLARQNMRLAACLAVVLNRDSVDDHVLGIVRKVALDTAAGYTRNVVQWLCSPNPGANYEPYQESGGLPSRSLESWLVMGPERLAKYLGFLVKMDVLQWRQVQASYGAWFLTDRVYELYTRVAGR